VAFQLVGCATAPPPPQAAVEPGAAPIQRNQGYALLYKLMQDESNVEKLLYFKHADEPIAGLVKEISTFANDALRQLDDFSKADKHLTYDINALPAVERQTRELTAKADAQALLTSSDKPFELNLVFTQSQAMGYGTDLAKASVQYETDPARKAFLTSVSKRCEQYRQRLMSMLTVH
jgi:hypothetical protein